MKYSYLENNNFLIIFYQVIYNISYQLCIYFLKILRAVAYLFNKYIDVIK